MDPEQLLTVEVGDDPGSWVAVGFSVDGAGLCRLGALVVKLTGTDGPRGMLGWSLGGGIEGVGACVAQSTPVVAHRNGVTATDHVVVMTPDGDRTTASLEEAGFEARRTRTFATGSTTTRQTFHWIHGTILEVVSDHHRRGVGPAQLWGLALTCDDFDAATAAMADHITDPKDAVQPGRRIASLRREIDTVSVPLAFMSPHVGS